MLASSASVAFPSYGTTEAVLSELRVIQEEYRHDVATYTLPSRSREHYRYRTGTPVLISWGAGRAAASFHGYVHHVEPVRRGAGAQMRVFCKGASQVFDNGLRAVYYNRTFPAVVAELARQYHFDVDARGHGRIFSSITSSDDRAWDLMVQYAKEIGYSFYAKDTRLLLHPRQELAVGLRDQAPVLRLGTTLKEFDALDGAAVPGQSRRKRVITGVDRRTGYSFRAVGGVVRGELGRQMYMTSGEQHINAEMSTPEEARWRLAAMAENDRYYVKARARAAGVANVHQMTPVYLENVDDPYLGTWCAEKVTHVMTRTAYTMELELGRDALFANTPPPAERPVRVLATRNNPQGRPKAAYPPTKLVNGRWQAQWSAATRSFA